MSLLLAVPSCLSLATGLFCPWSLLIAVPVPKPADVLQPMVVCPRLVWPLWELGQPGVLLSICPLPWHLCLGPFGALAGLLPCPTLVRVAISLAIWCPNSMVPSPGSVVMAALDLTLSQVSSFYLSALQVAIVNREYMVLGLLQRYFMEFLMCLWMPWKSQSLRCCWTSRSVTFLGHCNLIWWRSLLALWQRRGPSHGYLA